MTLSENKMLGFYQHPLCSFARQIAGNKKQIVVWPLKSCFFLQVFELRRRDEGEREECLFILWQWVSQWQRCREWYGMSLIGRSCMHAHISETNKSRKYSGFMKDCQISCVKFLVTANVVFMATPLIKACAFYIGRIWDFNILLNHNTFY